MVRKKALGTPQKVELLSQLWRSRRSGLVTLRDSRPAGWLVHTWAHAICGNLFRRKSRLAIFMGDLGRVGLPPEPCTYCARPASLCGRITREHGDGVPAPVAITALQATAGRDP